MKDYNKFLIEVGALFERYSLLNTVEVNNLNLSRCRNSFIGIRGQYYLNCSFKGKAYQKLFDITILIDKTGHSSIPILLLRNERKPPEFEHIYKDNTCCLGLTHEIISIWGEEQSAIVFFEKIINIFLINLISFQNYKKCATEERPHGVTGLLEYYAEVLIMSIKGCENTLPYILKRIKRKEYAKGHNICPCGSGRIIRNCHSSQINTFIKNLNSNPELRAGFLQDIREYFN